MENFNSIVGQSIAKKILSQAIRKDKIAHAYLFAGLGNLGKFKLAMEFAKALECQSAEHISEQEKNARCLRIERGADPDVFIMNGDKENLSDAEDDNESISVEKIRFLERQLSFSPYNSKYKIAIVDKAHNFTIEAANAFLKTLEEPKGNSVIILIAENLHSLPPTIISRTQVLRFWPVKDTAIFDFLASGGVSEKDAEKISFFSHGRPGIALELMRDIGKIKDREEEFKKFFNFIHGNLEERFVIAGKMAQEDEKLQSELKEWLAFSRNMLTAKYFSGKNFIGIEEKISDFKLFKFIKGLILTINLLSESAVNKKLALENLALEI